LKRQRRKYHELASAVLHGAEAEIIHAAAEKVPQRGRDGRRLAVV
jgi:hypothetical protein